MTAQTAFFRSMSLAEDLPHPDRFLHYHPTGRALPIVAQVLRAGAATMVIAPYGSGKSLAAGVGALFVENATETQADLAHLSARIARVDAGLAQALNGRLTAPVRGKVVVLSGLVGDPLAAISEAIGMKHAPKSVEGFGKAMREAGWDHVAIIWDEFGRHLEGLIADGRSSELDIIQRLAERVARADEPSLSLTLLLHQNLLAYATRLNETSRNEWRKIEGRFAALRLIEDSQEFFELVAEVVTSLRETSGYPASPPTALVKAAIAAGWFDGMSEEQRVSALLKGAAPLSPGALQVLPTLVARVGQNERSLFSFLREQDLGFPVGIEEVYVAFADAMRTDVGIGGTYRRWVETESARSRANSPLKRELLAAACLLQLGGSGERRRVPRAVVELAVASDINTAQTIARSFDELVSSRLLLWRQHNDDVAVWHGADIDVALRVREERDRRSGEFDLRTFLDERFPAPHVRAPGHNADFGVNRYLEGRYLLPRELASPVAVDAGSSGMVGYLLAEDRADIERARKLIAAWDAERWVLVIPDRPLDITGAALELVAIEALRADADFLASDPMIPTEVDELHSVAFEQLARLMRVLLDPSGTHARWYSAGEQLNVTAERPASVAASRLLSSWYRDTPRIANEQLMRTAASRTMQTARVRVVSAILERSDRASLGYEEGDGSAEASIYRTVVERTGLRRAEEERFADPDQIADPGLREVWTEIAAFFRQPTQGRTSRYRSLADLTNKLAAPPIGLPRAVMPVLIAAGYKHFARAIALYRDGVYVPDIMGFPFDTMVSASDAYCVRVLKITTELTEYLSEICYAFRHERPAAGDELVRAAYDAAQGWLLTVTDGARRSNRLGQHAKALLRAVGNANDPIELLIHDIPGAFGMSGPTVRLVERVEQARHQIDRLRDDYADEAVEVIRSSFERYAPDSAVAVDAIKGWAGCFDMEDLDRASALRIVDRSVVRKALETANGRFSEKSLANALSSILLQRSLDKWDDRTAPQFRTALREARERVEAASLDTDTPRAALRPIIEAKVADLRQMLAKIDGGEDIAADEDMKIVGGAR
ncbi:hypothetical protein [Sphingomonas sp.]|uniref:hypothetical protein n=1 Tax=Sphingomonas sp. TaxID=28214 RepID=UPI0025EC4545|nr:hypothetical protein [Sphingomonas sp.]